MKAKSAMRLPESPYIEQEEDVLRIKGTRVGIESIVAAFQEGESPETIAQEFPTVTLAQVYGAIAYYLENKQLIDDDTAGVNSKSSPLCARRIPNSMPASRPPVGKWVQSGRDRPLPGG